MRNRDSAHRGSIGLKASSGTPTPLCEAEGTISGDAKHPGWDDAVICWIMVTSVTLELWPINNGEAVVVGKYADFPILPNTVTD